MSQNKLSPQDISTVLNGVQNDMYTKFYIPVFQKTASELGLVINTEDDLTNLLELASMLRPANAEKQASTSPYAALVAQARGEPADITSNAKVASVIATYTQELAKSPEFIKLAKLSEQMAQQAMKLQ